MWHKVFSCHPWAGPDACFILPYYSWAAIPWLPLTDMLLVMCLALMWGSPSSLLWIMSKTPPCWRFPWKNRRLVDTLLIFLELHLFFLPEKPPPAPCDIRYSHVTLEQVQTPALFFHITLELQFPGCRWRISGYAVGYVPGAHVRLSIEFTVIMSKTPPCWRFPWNNRRLVDTLLIFLELHGRWSLGSILCFRREKYDGRQWVISREIKCIDDT
jgi:hypothetical protein